MSKDKWEKKDISLIKNEEITCKNCHFRGSMVATCVAYENLKPLSVLRGGNCPKKEVQK
jgi:hypothetical protein